MPKVLELAGKTFYNVHVLASAGSSPRGESLWECECLKAAPIATEIFCMYAGALCAEMKKFFQLAPSRQIPRVADASNII